MATYDSSSRDAYRDLTAQRLARSRQRASRQRRVTFGGFLLLILLVALVLYLRAPAAPQLFVTWPNPQKYGKRVLEDGATVLIRSGQPFSVGVTQGEDWLISGSTKDITVKGPSITWSPTESTSKLEVRAQPVARGLSRAVSWLWPTRVLTLLGTTGVPSGKSRLHIVPEPGRPVWLSSQVLADTQVTWDERAIPLLQSQLQAELRAQPRSGAYWSLQNAFGDTPEAGDVATYASLRDLPAGLDMQDTMSAIARAIAKKAPATNIKFIVRSDDGKTWSGVLRLAFDGKPQRAGWVRNPGDTVATPFFWWEDINPPGAGMSSLQPSLPRRR